MAAGGTTVDGFPFDKKMGGFDENTRGTMVHIPPWLQRGKFENVIEVKHGEPMVFAKGTKGIKLDGFKAVVVDMEKHSLDDLLVHDETNLDLAHIIANWTTHPVLPEPIGVIYSVDKPTYNSEMVAQVDSAIKAKGAGKVQDLLNAGDTWTVK